jgi:hypothetical protein
MSAENENSELIFDFWCEMRKNQIGEEKMTGDSN